ncbi:MAG: hypothetical protein JF888_00485 [Candidatus Dormibacteraeota bacterium]|uniref:Thioredoxin-like fold domain-containing protein n=1 Tax=Candidatus Dormiibacter inghamiae TaxID=3127013 RepID=A0A934N5R7_9BACT|nr:hypothetical protein [Candidatus Dormibacteraeota bacterium]MBJ7607738.1 hypothetical protein [Candidatus Dormibacteraeota bacterium]
MAILNQQLKEQLKRRFSERLRDPVQLTLYTRPGSGRLILPGGLGCATCGDARELADDLAAAAPEQVRLEVVDVSERTELERPVPSLTLGATNGEADQDGGRLGWQGLPAGYEFATVVDAIERVSRSEHGLAEATLDALSELTEPVDLMVFATPT